MFYSGKWTDADQCSRLIVLKKEGKKGKAASTWQFRPVKEGPHKFPSPQIYLSLASFIFGIKVHQSMSSDLNITHPRPFCPLQRHFDSPRRYPVCSVTNTTLHAPYHCCYRLSGLACGLRRQNITAVRFSQPCITLHYEPFCVIILTTVRVYNQINCTTFRGQDRPPFSGRRVSKTYTQNVMQE